MHNVHICIYANPFVRSGFDSDWPCECYFERKPKQEKHLCVWMSLNYCVPVECQDAKVLLWPRTSGSVTVAHNLCRRAKVSSVVSSDLEDDSTLSAAVRCDIEPDGCCCLDRCEYSEHLKLVSQCQSKQTGAAGPISCARVRLCACFCGWMNLTVTFAFMCVCFLSVCSSRGRSSPSN